MSKQTIEDYICNHFIFAPRTDGFCEAVSYLVVMSLAQHHFVHSESSNLLLVKKLAMNFIIMSQKQLTLNSAESIFHKDDHYI